MNSWDASVERAQVVHTIDDHSDIIHVVYRPVWVWPLYDPASPVALVLVLAMELTRRLTV